MNILFLVTILINFVLVYKIHKQNEVLLDLVTKPKPTPSKRVSTSKKSTQPLREEWKPVYYLNGEPVYYSKEGLYYFRSDGEWLVRTFI